MVDGEPGSNLHHLGISILVYAKADDRAGLRIAHIDILGRVRTIGLDCGDDGEGQTDGETPLCHVTVCADPHEELARRARSQNGDRRDGVGIAALDLAAFGERRRLEALDRTCPSSFLCRPSHLCRRSYREASAPSLVFRRSPAPRKPREQRYRRSSGLPSFRSRRLLLTFLRIDVPSFRNSTIRRDRR